MGRYETIGTTIGMKQVYNGDLVAEMRKKYHDEDFHMTHKDHRRYVNRACDLAEQVDDPQKFLTNEIYRARLWFGICLDSERWHLNPEKAAEDLDILSIRKKVNDQHAEERARLRELLDRSKEMIPEDEWIRILEKYELQDGLKKRIKEHWHRVITGKAVALAREIIQNGTQEELKQALIYLKVCIDANKHMLDYKRFGKENDIEALGNKYGVDMT